MTLLEQDLLAALKELLETSSEITSGAMPVAGPLERYDQAKEWAKRVIALAENGK